MDFLYAHSHFSCTDNCSKHLVVALWSRPSQRTSRQLLRTVSMIPMLNITDRQVENHQRSKTRSVAAIFAQFSQKQQQQKEKRLFLYSWWTFTTIARGLFQTRFVSYFFVFVCSPVIFVLLTTTAYVAFSFPSLQWGELGIVMTMFVISVSDVPSFSSLLLLLLELFSIRFDKTLNCFWMTE